MATRFRITANGQTTQPLFASDVLPIILDYHRTETPFMAEVEIKGRYLNSDEPWTVWRKLDEPAYEPDGSPIPPESQPMQH